MRLDWWTQRDAWELRLQRVAFAGLVYLAFHAQPRYSGQPFPVGIATWIDFSFLGDRTVAPWTDLALLAALACYVAGRAMPIAVAVMAALYTGAGALAYSQGMLEHHTQMLALVLLAQLVAYLQARVSRRAAARRHALATLYSLEVIAASYVMAGLMKLLLSQGEWVMQLPMIVTDIAKAHGQEFCTTGDAALIPRADVHRDADSRLSHPHPRRAGARPAVRARRRRVRVRARPGVRRRARSGRHAPRHRQRDGHPLPGERGAGAHLSRQCPLSAGRPVAPRVCVVPPGAELIAPARIHAP